MGILIFWSSIAIFIALFDIVPTFISKLGGSIKEFSNYYPILMISTVLPELFGGILADKYGKKAAYSVFLFPSISSTFLFLFFFTGDPSFIYIHSIFYSMRILGRPALYRFVHNLVEDKFRYRFFAIASFIREILEQ